MNRHQIYELLLKLSLKDLQKLASEFGVPRARFKKEQINNLLFIQTGGARYNKEALSRSYLIPLESAFKKRGEKIQDDVIETFRKADPTSDGKYTEWIIKSYLSDGIKRIEDLSSRVLPALQSYEKLFKIKALSQGEPGKPWTNERDINNFIGLSGAKKGTREYLGLEDLVEKYGSKLGDVSKQIEKSKQVHENLELVYENDLAKVYHPLTEEAACYIGRGTRWCTASTKGENRFDEYNKDGPIYTIVPKNPEYIGEKYQFHHETNQYMDEKDEEVDSLWLFDRYRLEHEISKIFVDVDKTDNKLVNKWADSIMKLKIKNPSNDYLNKFKNLQEIRVRFDKIDSLLKLNNKFRDKIISLDLTDNKLTRLPDSIFEPLQNLQKLDLSHNNLTDLPPEIGSLQNLRELDLRLNKLTSLPPEIGALQNLQWLDLSSNNLTKLPGSIFEPLQNLRTLWLSDNNLTGIPPEIGSLHNLQELYLNYNNLTGIPPEIRLLQRLQELYLRFNKLTSIPPEIRLLQNLQILHLNSNKLTRLPPEIGLLQNLQILDLSHNNLTALPPEIGLLQNLQELYLSGNKLTEIPLEIKKIKDLKIYR